MKILKKIYNKIISEQNSVVIPNFEGEIIDATGCIVMPGLINGHTHIYSTFARGLSVPFAPENFVEILAS